MSNPQHLWSWNSLNKWIWVNPGEFNGFLHSCSSFLQWVVFMVGERWRSIVETWLRSINFNCGIKCSLIFKSAALYAKSCWRSLCDLLVDYSTKHAHVVSNKPDLQREKQIWQMLFIIPGFSSDCRQASELCLKWLYDIRQFQVEVCIK